MPQEQHLLTPAETAAMFGVSTRTIMRWADAGRLSVIRTLGGHRRFDATEVRRALESSETVFHARRTPPPPQQKD